MTAASCVEAAEAAEGVSFSAKDSAFGNGCKKTVSLLLQRNYR